MRKLSILMTGILLPLIIYSQQFEGYLGAGFSDGITVTSSSNLEREHWNEVASGHNTINGNGLDYKEHTASRFLSQATLGADLNHIMEAAKLGSESWIDSQFVKESELLLPKLNETFEDVLNWRIIQGTDTNDLPDRPYWNIFNYAWWELNMRNEDLLRQRVAMALSEILVVSFNSDLSGFGWGMADYYDIFIGNAFGNYRDILEEVTLHPCMGFYLSHLNNPKAIPEENIHPDENYAREIMQLFTIGLYELNPDGTRKTNGNGNFIPTYGQEDIREFAKVFTGLSIGAIYENEWVDDPYFGIGIWVANMTESMIMYEEWHDQDTKSLLNGIQLPAGQTGLKDIDDALDVLFEHPNVGPFIGRQLIQRLVTSNPSPGYVSRVTAAFDDNGEGVRGDMKSIIKAILLDDEARSCTASMDPFHGKMREPLIKYSHTARALEKEHYYDRYWNTAYNFLESTDQSPLFARSVFNFFLPDFQPNGDLQNEGLFGPEFQIHNSRTSIDYINEVNYWTYYGVLMNSWEENDPYVFPDYEGLKYLAREPEVLINRLDLLFTHGMMSSHTRENIKTAMESLYSDDYRKNRAKMGLYLTLISPDNAILR